MAVRHDSMSRNDNTVCKYVWATNSSYVHIYVLTPVPNLSKPDVLTWDALGGETASLSCGHPDLCSPPPTAFHNAIPKAAPYHCNTVGGHFPLQRRVLEWHIAPAADDRAIRTHPSSKILNRVQQAVCVDPIHMLPSANSGTTVARSYILRLCLIHCCVLLSRRDIPAVRTVGTTSGRVMDRSTLQGKVHDSSIHYLLMCLREIVKNRGFPYDLSIIV